MIRKIFGEFFGPRLNGFLGFILRSAIHGVVLTVLWGPKLPIPAAMDMYLIIAFTKRITATTS